MRVVIQRVKNASVIINNETRRDIGKGYLILLGIENSDKIDDIEWLCGKISRIRLFTDDHGLMNKSISEVQGNVLLISQFTLYASTKKGNRPSFTKAAQPNIAIPLYKEFIHKLETILRKPIETGEFGAQMEVSLINDGPVTLTIDTKNKE